jgi:hypothetical protein
MNSAGASTRRPPIWESWKKCSAQCQCQ